MKFIASIIVAALIVTSPGPWAYNAVAATRAGEEGTRAHDVGGEHQSGDENRQLSDGTDVTVTPDVADTDATRVELTGEAEPTILTPAAPLQHAEAARAGTTGAGTTAIAGDGPTVHAETTELHDAASAELGSTAAKTALDTLFERSKAAGEADSPAVQRARFDLENLRRTAPNGRYRYKAVARLERNLESPTPELEAFVAGQLAMELHDPRRLRATDAAVGALARLAASSASVEIKKGSLQAILQTLSGTTARGLGWRNSRYARRWAAAAAKISLSMDDPSVRGALESDPAERVAIPAPPKAVEAKGHFQSVRTLLPAGMRIHPVAAAFSIALIVWNFTSLAPHSLFLALVMTGLTVEMTAQALWRNHHIANIFQVALMGSLFSQAFRETVLGIFLSHLGVHTFLIGAPVITLMLVLISYGFALASYRRNFPGTGLAANGLLFAGWFLILEEMAMLTIELLMGTSPGTLPRSRGITI